MPKIEKPSCKCLMDEMKKHKEPNWSAIGKKFNITGRTAHIWAEQYGLVPVKYYLGKNFY